MDISLVISPLAGAVIGYFTNYVAVKMLFRPYNQIKIGHFKVPFTPGLIPKEKERIAAALGKAVGENILTSDAIKEYLLAQEMTEYVHRCTKEKVIELNKSDYTLNDAGSIIKPENWESIKYDLCTKIYSELIDILKSEETAAVLSDNIYSKLNNVFENKAGNINQDSILDFIEYIFNTVFSDFIESGKLQTITEKGIWNFLLSLEKDQRLIKEAVSYASVNELKDYLVLKVPETVNMLLTFTENPDIEDMLKEHVKSALEDIAGPFMGMFIDSDDIYCKIITNITEYFNNPENTGEIEKFVSLAVDNLTDKSVGEVSSLILSQTREKTINKIVMFVFNEFKHNAINEIFRENFKIYISKNSNKTLNSVLSGFDNNFNSKLKELTYNTVSAILSNADEFINECNFKNTLNRLFDIKVSRLLTLFSENEESISQKAVEIYKKAVSSFAVSFFSKLNVSKIAEERINTFEMGYLEGIILSIAKKELSAITYLGGVLGFIIGLVPCVLSFFY